jgi:glycosyltransferase involved in cell wall biosynthesis
MENINYIAPVNSLGYGVLGLNLLKAFLENDVEVAYFPVAGNQSLEVEPCDVETIKSVIKNQETFDVNAHSLRVWHQFDMAMHVGRGTHAGFPIFELDTFTSREIHHLKSLDHIFVTSQWAKDIIYFNGIKVPTTVAPLGVNTNIFKPLAMKDYLANYNKNKTVFLNIGKWEIRKGHDVLCEAFNKAFLPTDDVELWMMNHNPFLNEEQDKNWKGMYKNSPLGDKVKLLDRVQTHKEVADIMRQADCGVFPARAEGWNLELLECMACGCDVIATNYSAHTEFCNENNCHLIEIDEDELAYDGIWFHEQGSWAALNESQIDQLAIHMRNVYEAKKQGKQSINMPGVETASGLSWSNTAKTIMTTLS